MPAQQADNVKIQNMTSWDLSYYLLRANFDGVQSEYCNVPAADPNDGNAVHLHDHKVVGLDDRGDHVNVSFEKANGEKGSMTADLVVGADGPNSTVRGLFLSNIQRTYAGYCALRGTVPENEATDAAREVREHGTLESVNRLIVGLGFPRAIYLFPWPWHSDTGVHNPRS